MRYPSPYAYRLLILRYRFQIESPPTCHLSPRRIGSGAYDLPRCRCRRAPYAQRQHSARAIYFLIWRGFRENGAIDAYTRILRPRQFKYTPFYIRRRDASIRVREFGGRSDFGELYKTTLERRVTRGPFRRLPPVRSRAVEIRLSRRPAPRCPKGEYLLVFCHLFYFCRRRIFFTTRPSI